MTGDLSPSPRSVPIVRPRPEAQLGLDAALGAVGAAVGAAVVVGRAGESVARLLWRPPLVPTSLQPRSLVYAAARRGRVERLVLARRLSLWLDAVAPALVEALVDRLDVARLVEEHVDLDALVATVDLDAAVARVDIDAAVARVDIDGAVGRVDLDRAVARVDVDAIVRRVAIDKILERVDIDAIVDRIDLDVIATRLDVDAVVARVDLDAVIDRIDLADIAEEVIDEIDLPAIIRDSTGSMASETVRGVRMGGITADDAVSRVVDRALLRRRRRADRDGAGS